MQFKNNSEIEKLDNINILEGKNLLKDEYSKLIEKNNNLEKKYILYNDNSRPRDKKDLILTQNYLNKRMKKIVNMKKNYKSKENSNINHGTKNQNIFKNKLFKRN